MSDKVSPRRRRWAPGRLPYRLELPPVGVALGLDAGGMAVTFPLLVPRQSTRVGVVGERSLARLIALRLLRQSCDLTVISDRSDDWQRLALGAPEHPFSVSPTLRRWPAGNSPPPWALVIDMPDPPSPGFTREPWSTVVHQSETVPSRSGWWESAHLVLTTRAHLKAVAAIRPRLDAAELDGLTDDDVVAVDQRGVTVFRPSVTGQEYSALFGRVRARHA